MFPATQSTGRQALICLVSSAESSLTGKIADCQGRRIHILYAGAAPLSAAMVSRLRTAGITLSLLSDNGCPAEFGVANLYPSSHVDRSDQVRYALQALHNRYHFDLIEFDTHHGFGFRSVQAKQAGMAFLDVPLACRLDMCNSWLREERECWPSCFEEVELEFLERYSFEKSDIQVSPNLDLLFFAQRRGWSIHDGKHAPHRNLAESKSIDHSPLVTIGIAYYNLGLYLPATLASLAAQSYRRLEVLVIDDGSTDPQSIRVFSEMKERYPEFQFLRQANAGIGATRNRCLSLARGEFFIPVDADNIARPDMVARFVTALVRNPHYSAMSCYFLAFADDASLHAGNFLYACRPTAGPHVLSPIRNVYGDANAIFRTRDFREVAGYETDRGTSCEDWEAFVKLIHGGKRIGVVPEYLFYYRHLAGGFSRSTKRFANHQRVLRQFKQVAGFPSEEAPELCTTLLGLHRRIEQLVEERCLLRYRLADRIHSVLATVPGVLKLLKRVWLFPGIWVKRLWHAITMRKEKACSAESSCLHSDQNRNASYIRS